MTTRCTFNEFADAARYHPAAGVQVLRTVLPPLVSADYNHHARHRTLQRAVLPPFLVLARCGLPTHLPAAPDTEPAEVALK